MCAKKKPSLSINFVNQQQISKVRLNNVIVLFKYEYICYHFPDFTNNKCQTEGAA